MARIGLLLLFVIICCSLTPSLLNAQSDASIDSAYDRRIERAWEQVRDFNSQNAAQRSVDNPQHKFAAEFFSYYLHHPETRVGRKAIQSAFAMWQNLADVHAVEEAMPRIRRDSEIWELILNSIEVTYANAGRWKAIPGLLDSLSHRLTHPRSLAEVLLSIGSARLYEAEDSLARRSFTRVLSLAADSSQKQRAYDGLYEIDSLHVGSPAPEFSATSIQGERLHLSDFREKNVLLEFTGTYCGPCRLELPYLKEAYAKYAAKNFAFLAVSLDKSDSTVERYVAEKQVPWPHILAPEENADPIVQKYRVIGIPRIFLIDRDGRIAAKNLRGDAIIPAMAKLADK